MQLSKALVAGTSLVFALAGYTIGAHMAGSKGSERGEPSAIAGLTHPTPRPSEHGVSPNHGTGSIGGNNIAELLEALPPAFIASHIEAFAALIKDLARKDPEAALRILENKNLGELRLLADAMVSGWLERDPQRALGWALSHSKKISWEILVKNVVDGNHIGVLQQKIANLEPGRFKYDLIRETAAAWGVSSGPELAAWIDSFPLNDPSRDSVIRGFLSGWAQHNPLSAGKWALAETTPGEQRKNAILAVTASTIAAGRGDEYTEWLLQQPVDPDMSSALHALASNLIKHDDFKTALLAVKQVTSAERDFVAAMVGSAAARRNYQAGFDYLSDMTSPRHRKPIVANIFRTWSGINKSEALAYLSSASGILTSDEVAQAQTILQP